MYSSGDRRKTYPPVSVKFFLVKFKVDCHLKQSLYTVRSSLVCFLSKIPEKYFGFVYAVPGEKTPLNYYYFCQGGNFKSILVGILGEKHQFTFF